MRPEHIKVITPLSRGLPKTGQETCYMSGDDGNYEAGWWLGLFNANNRTRFVVKEYKVGEPVVVDLATKLIWPKSFTSVICMGGGTCWWFIAVDWPLGKEYGGFSDWRIPNFIELMSLINYETNNPAVWDIFDNVNHDNNYAWSGTTRKAITTQAWAISLAEGRPVYSDKVTVTNRRIIAVRSA